MWPVPGRDSRDTGRVADVTERMLALLSTLQTGRSFSGTELTRRLGVSPRTLRRDVDRLRGYGYPVDTRPGPGGYYRLVAGRTLPPLVLDDDEATATLLALAALAATGPDSGPAGGIDEAATRAYGKLEQFLPRRLRPRVAAIRASLETGPQRGPAVPAERLAAIAEAIRHRETVTFTYTDARGAGTRRRVEPYRQLHHLLRWYLLGWDVDRADWRVFRLDRVGEPVRTGTRFAARPLPARTALDYLRQGLNRDRQPVRLVIEAPAADVIDALRHQDADIAPLSDGRTAVTLAVDSWEWLLLNLAFLDANFTISAPARFTAACRAFAARLLAATTETGGGP